MYIIASPFPLTIYLKRKQNRIFDPQTTTALNKNKLHELTKEVDPQEVLDEDVENLLLHIADDFIEKTIISACGLAKHRKANTINVSDVQVEILSKIFHSNVLKATSFYWKKYILYNLKTV